MSSNEQMQLINSRYQLGDRLGAGGMGAVFRAYDRLTGEAVALKRVLLSATSLAMHDPDSLRLSLSREFQTLGTLRHPNIIGVLDYGFDADRQPYFTMSLLENAQTITRAGQKRPLNERVRLIIDMLHALVYFHRRGILHRDLKPGNVLVNDIGQVKVLDFGLAITSEQEAEAGGTLRYIAPEVLRGGKASFGSDLYAVGVIAYEMIVGAHPFETANMPQMMHDILHKAPDLARVQTVIDGMNRVSMLETDEAPTQMVIGAASTTAPVDKEDAPTTDLSADLLTRLTAQQKMPYMPPTAVNTLVEVIGKLLEKDPAQRFNRASDVIEALYRTTGQAIPREQSEIRESFLQASAFVGRDAELQHLIGALDATEQSNGSAWLISGESGVGKSRLLDEIRIRALVSGALVLRGQAAAEGRLPYQLWRDVLRRLVISTPLSDLEAGVIQQVVPEIDALIERPVAPAPMLDAKSAQQRLALTLIDVLSRQTQPLLLVLEDVHWAGESLEPLKAIIHAAPKYPWMIVASARYDEMPDLPTLLPGINVLRLARLDDPAIEALSAAMLGEAGTRTDVLDLLKRETEGNTLFMVEVVRTLAEEAGSLSRIGTAALPTTIFTGGIQQILQRRLSRIPAWAQHALKLAAVIGRGIDPKLMTDVFAGQSRHDVESWLTVCANAAVFDVVDGVWRFTHDKLRETLRAGLLDAEKRALHAQAAMLIDAEYGEQIAYADALAEHWSIAEKPEKALFYIEKAAEWHCLFTADYVRGQQLAERGLAWIDHLPELSRYRPLLLRHLGEILERRSQFAESAVQYEACIASAPDNLLIMAQGFNGLCRTCWRQGDYTRGFQYALRALSLSQAVGDMRSVSQALSNLGVVSLYQGDFANAKSYFEQAGYLCKQIEDRRGMASAMNNLGIIALETGQFDDATHHYEQALSAYRDIGDRSGTGSSLNNLGLVSLQRGDLDNARRLFEESLVLRRQINDLRGSALALLNIGEIYLVWRDYQTARSHLDQSLAIYRKIGDRRGISMCLIDLGSTAMAARDFAQAVTYTQEASELSRDMGDKRGTAVSLNSLAHIYAVSHAFEKARECIREAKSLGELMNTPPLILETIGAGAQLIFELGDAVQAALLIGMLRAHPARRSDTNHVQLEDLFNQLQEALPEAELNASLESGASLSMDEAFHLILDIPSPV